MVEEAAAAAARLSARLTDRALAPYDRGDAAEELFDVWLGVAAEFTQGRLEAEAAASFTADLLGRYLDERTGGFGADTDDYFVRLLMQQFAKILDLFVEKPKLAAAVQDARGAGLLLNWLGGSACPALCAAAFGSAAPPSHRIEYMRALTAVFAVEGVALAAGREGLSHDPLEQLLACVVSLDEDQLARAAATELLLATLRHPRRAARSSHAARTLASTATTHAAMSLVWQLGGLGDAEALPTLQRRCSADAGVAVEVLGSLCDAVGDLSGSSGVDAARDAGPICAILRAAGSRPGPSAEEGVPRLDRVGSGRSTAAAAAAAAAVTPMDLFRAILGRCPDNSEYLQCLLEPELVPVEAIELLSAQGAAIPEALWTGVILPFAAQLLHRAHRARSPAGSRADPAANQVQETALLVRDCAMVFYPLGQSAARGLSPDLGLALFRCLLSAIHAGYTQTERFAECAAQVCAMHLSQGSTRWLVEMLSSDDAADLTKADPIEVAQWGAANSGAVALALLGLESGDGTGTSGSHVTLDDTQMAAVLSTFAGVPISHKTLYLFTTLGRDYRLLAHHSAAIGTLLSNLERWVGELVGRLSASTAPPSYAKVGQMSGGGGGGSDGTAAAVATPVVIAAVDLDLLGCVIEMLRVLVPHLHPSNALLLFDLALKVLALLPAEHSGTDATGYTDTMLEAVIRCIASGGGVARISAAAFSQACTVSGVRTRSLLAQLLPEHMLSDPAPMVRAEALRTLGTSASSDWVQRCGHTVLSASIARAGGSGSASDADRGDGRGSNRVDEVLRLLHLDVKEAEFEVEQLQLAIAAAPCLAEVAQVAGELGRQAAERLAAFSRLSQFSDPMREPHPAIAAAEERVPEVHQSIYATQDGIRVGAAGAPGAEEAEGGAGMVAGLELVDMQQQHQQQQPPPLIAACTVPVVACADDGGGGGGGRAAIPAGVVLATAVEPVVAHLAGGGEPDSPAAAILQAVVVQESDASWEGIQRIHVATAHYVVEGGKDQDPDAEEGCGELLWANLSKGGHQEKCSNPVRK